MGKRVVARLRINREARFKSRKSHKFATLAKRLVIKGFSVYIRLIIRLVTNIVNYHGRLVDRQNAPYSC